MIKVLIPLFVDAQTEIINAPGQPLTTKNIAAVTAGIKERLRIAAKLIEKLTASGWHAVFDKHIIDCHHPEINSTSEARARLRKLGINPKSLRIIEQLDESIEDDESFVNQNWQEEIDAQCEAYARAFGEEDED